MESRNIRKASGSDLARLVELSEIKREEYQDYQPIFWRKAPDSAKHQLNYFHSLLEREEVIILLYDKGDGKIDGFIIGRVVPSPPVYNSGGFTLAVDDFVVEGAKLWKTVGVALLDALQGEANNRGIVQMVVVCPAQEEPKRAMLEAAGFPVVTEWRVKTLYASPNI